MLVLGIDQGTSGSKAIVLDEGGAVLGTGYRPVPRLHPQPGWTEQDPDTVAATVREAIADALGAAGVVPANIAAVGIASQRDTDFAWDVTTGRPVANAISWQDLRTAPILDELRASPLWAEAHHRLGQHPATYSAAMHLAWRMRHDHAVIGAARAGRLRVGLSAEWIVQALGSLDEHAMDYSLVQGLSMFDIRADAWWPEYLDWLGVPSDPLPVPRPSLHPYGTLRIEGPTGAPRDVPVLAMLGDQQAALLGYDCRTAGDAECTHGTATFVDVCAGPAAPSADRMQSYYAWTLPGAAGDGSVDRTWCLEGDATVTGAAIRWLKEGAGILADEREIGPLAATVADAGGVTFVPAFAGLMAPDRDERARGSILGMTLGTTRAHIARALLDSIAFQVRAILDEVEEELGVPVQRLKVGGGVSASDVACQVQADRIGVPILRPSFTDTTPRAAALLAGIGAGAWPSIDALPTLPGTVTTFEPALAPDRREADQARWRETVALIRGYRG